jgi:hypothetical protein
LSSQLFIYLRVAVPGFSSRFTQSWGSWRSITYLGDFDIGIILLIVNLSQEFISDGVLT